MPNLYLVRNVARLVELPTWQRPEIRPWSADEARRFLEAAASDPLYPAFLLLVPYGLRRGEALGLRWSDVDFSKSHIHICQQVQRLNGELMVGPVKTRAGRRVLPLISILRDALLARWAQTGTSGLVFATRHGTPTEPRNLVRSFHRIREAAGLRRIRVHDLRHTAATIMKVLRVPARDVQLILGHSTVTITQEIYQHDDLESRADALEQVERLFLRAPASMRCRQMQPSGAPVDVTLTSILSGRGGSWRIEPLIALQTCKLPLSKSEGCWMKTALHGQRQLHEFSSAVSQL